MHSLILLLLAFYSLTVSAAPLDGLTKTPPVCIIGAGPAGLSAAGRLEQKGIKAVIFDEQAEVGGKCQAWYDDQGIFHPLGAAFFSNVSYPETLKVINQTNVPIEPFFLAGVRESYRYDYISGAIEVSPPTPLAFAAALLAEIPRYANLWRERFQPISTTNYKLGVPEEFTVSGAQWFRQNNFTALPIVLVNPVALYGYGDINIVPALYILQYFTPDIVGAFIGVHEVYYMDFHRMFVEWTKSQLCKTTIHTSTQVRGVDRSGNTPIVKYTKPGNETCEQACSSIIFAFPPHIDNLKRAGLDLSDEEHDLFSNVTTHQYSSSSVEFKLPFGVSYIAESSSLAVPPPNNGEAIAVLRLSKQSNVSVAWSWGPYEHQSEEEAFQLVIESMSKINKDPRNATELPEPVTADDVKAFRKWDYMPHFASQPLREGAYTKLNQLQGHKKSYWASGLSGMEIVEWAIRGGHEVVDSYF